MCRERRTHATTHVFTLTSKMFLHMVCDRIGNQTKVFNEANGNNVTENL